MKSLRSRYAIAQIDNKNYQTITVGNKSESTLDAGYIWGPYILSSSKGFVIESKQETRKRKISNIIDNL